MGLDGCGLSRPPPGFDHRTVQPVASRHIDLIEAYTVTVCFVVVATPAVNVSRNLCIGYQQIEII